MPDSNAGHAEASSRPTHDEHTPLLKSDSHDPEQPRETADGADGANGAESSAAADELVEEPSTLKLTMILGSAWFGVFLNALDATVIATLSGPISNSFNSFALFSWLASAYLISNAAFQPLSGKLTDIYGRRSGLVVSFIFFFAGNLICGLATAEWVMILGRVVAGIGGGCINTIATVVASDLVPLRRRGLVQGVGNVFYGVGGGLGGALGGWIGDTFSWRWAFLFQCPLILVSGIIVFFTVRIPVKESDKSKIKRVDFLGSFTLVATLVLFLLGLNAGGNTVPWNHPLVYISIPLSLVLLVIYVYVEDKLAPEPIIPVRLLLEPTVMAACLCNWFASMAIFGFIFYAPLFFEALGESSTRTGLRLVPLSLGTAIGSIGSGLLMRSTGKYYWLTVASALLFAVSTGGHVFILRLGIPDWPAYITFAIYGLSYGSLLTITLIAMISAVGHEFQAVITSASYAFRSTGSTIGISICSAVFQNVLKDRLWEEIGGQKHSKQWIDAVHDSVDALRKLPARWQLPALRAYTDALQAVWVTVAVLVVMSCICGAFMREHTLHNNLARK